MAFEKDGFKATGTGHTHVDDPRRGDYRRGGWHI